MNVSESRGTEDEPSSFLIDMGKFALFFRFLGCFR
jgi:hypothetical protein